MLVDALNRHRGKGQQRVTVEHVHVHAGGLPNGRCRMHGGMSPGAPKGNKNALKHGHYTAKAIASRREIARVLREARALVKEVN